MSIGLEHLHVYVLVDRCALHFNFKLATLYSVVLVYIDAQSKQTNTDCCCCCCCCCCVFLVSISFSILFSSLADSGHEQGTHCRTRHSPGVARGRRRVRGAVPRAEHGDCVKYMAIVEKERYRRKKERTKKEKLHSIQFNQPTLCVLYSCVSFTSIHTPSCYCSMLCVCVCV